MPVDQNLMGIRVTSIQCALLASAIAGLLACASDRPIKSAAQAHRSPSSEPLSGFRTPLWSIQEVRKFQPPRSTETIEWKADRLVESGDAILGRRAFNGSSIETPMIHTVLTTSDELFLNDQISKFLFQIPRKRQLDPQVAPCTHWIETESIAGRKFVCLESSSVPLLETAETRAARELIKNATRMLRSAPQ